jgi:hypothetical protein
LAERDRRGEAHRLSRPIDEPIDEPTIDEPIDEPIDEKALVAQAESYATLELESVGVSGRSISCCACLSRSAS